MYAHKMTAIIGLAPYSNNPQTALDRRDETLYTKQHKTYGKAHIGKPIMGLLHLYRIGRMQPDDCIRWQQDFRTVATVP